VRAHFLGYIFDQVQGGKSTKATIILVDGQSKSIRIDQNIYLPIINGLQEWIKSEPEIPQARLISIARFVRLKLIV
jgi:hypothetical protein